MRVIKDVKKLHQVAKPMEFTESNERHRQKIVDDMLETYYNFLEKKAQGLSAVQIGYNESCILLRFDKTRQEPPIVVFNPKVILKIGFKASHEGCLSEGDRRWYVFRPLLCYVSYQLFDGTVVKKWLTYKKARIFCHEYDHTKGILLQDKGWAL